MMVDAYSLGDGWMIYPLSGIRRRQTNKQLLMFMSERREENDDVCQTLGQKIYYITYDCGCN